MYLFSHGIVDGIVEFYHVFQAENLLISTSTVRVEYVQFYPHFT